MRPRPIIAVTLVGPGGAWPEMALLDTGADDTVFPEAAAKRIGLNLTGAPTGSGRGAGKGLLPLKYARVALRLTDGREFREWPAWVGFTPAPLSRPLLGFAGCLQFFDANFLGAREAVELDVNSLYPGT